MLQRMRAVRKGENGFTLTELLITIIILGVLAGIVVFAVGAFTNDGKAVACQTDKKNVEVAVDAYYAKTGAYPTGVDNDARIAVLVTNKYLKEAPSTTQGYTITLTDLTGVVGSTGAC